MMTRLMLAVILAAPAAFSQDKAKTPATPEIVKSVEEFVKTPMSDLPPESIEGFLRVDPTTLPKRLQEPYKARRLELYTLKQVVESKKKGMIRMMDKTCDVPEETNSASAGVYKAAGYGEITPDDVACSIDRTHCSEKELMCEFTLREVVEVKNGKKKYRFFLHPNDPLMAIVTACRGNTGGQTNFFGAMTPTCTH